MSEIIGLVAACLTTLCWAPQAIRIVRTRDTRSISLIAQSSFTLGVLLWLVYGLLIASAPIIFANALTFMLASAILAMKLRFG